MDFEPLRYGTVCFLLLLLAEISLAQPYAPDNGQVRFLKEFARAIFPLTWNFDLNPCGNWDGIVCDATNNSVTELDLSAQPVGLTGVLTWNLSTSAFGNSLSPDAVYGSHIGGGQTSQTDQPIPVTPLAGLRTLKKLDLSRNTILGNIPSEFQIMMRLQFLRLDHNLFSGSIPEGLGNLNLTCLDLSNNNLTGSIPKSLSQFPCVDFQGNSLLNITEGSCQSGASSCPQPAVISPPVVTRTVSDVPVIVGGIVGGIALIALSIVGFLLLKRYQEKRNEARREELLAHDLEMQIAQRHFGSLRRFSKDELSAATNEFSEDNLVGEGGFSRVYKGRLEDSGKVVAIKRINEDNSRGALSYKILFLDEVEIIGRTSHRHLMQVEGFCVEREDCMLVMPFMANGSVATRIQDKEGNPMDWKTRKNVALGAAEGIAYMHNDCSPKLIHRDIKAANVLLDDNDEAIIADFGLARADFSEEKTDGETEGGGNESQISVQAEGNGGLRRGENEGGVKGTRGYIAPECMMNGEATEKSDVYSFGVFLLELVSAMDVQQMCDEMEMEDLSMRDWVLSLVKAGHIMKLVDRELLSPTPSPFPESDSLSSVSDALLSPPASLDIEGIKKILLTAASCLEMEPSKRPDMATVVNLLSPVNAGGGASDLGNTRSMNRMVNSSRPSGGSVKARTDGANSSAENTGEVSTAGGDANSNKWKQWKEQGGGEVGKETRLISETGFVWDDEELLSPTATASQAVNGKAMQ